ncbi:hypothetical protein [Flavobacterium sp.]|uniref:hypothetical protein n=1 Tax=Flavobacterium sp. TaxID=239 RepID=UPI003751AE52
MRDSIFLFIIFLITNNYCYSQQNNNKELVFKNSIESSIEVDSNSINPLINKIKTLLNDGDIDSLSMNEYKNCKSTFKANRKLVNNLEEVDDKINLKNRTIKYLENNEKILDSFILPIIIFLHEPNQSKLYDKNKLNEGLILLESSVNLTSELSTAIDEFCTKYKLPRKMSELEKKKYQQQIEKTKIKLKN